MAVTTWRMDQPTGAESPTTLDTIIRDLKEAIRERLAIDHRFVVTGNTVDDADIGKHIKISISAAINTPEVASGQAVIYGKLAADGQMELFFKNYNDSEIQLTNSGILNVAPSAMNAIVDNVSLAISGDKLIVKDGGVTLAKLATDVADNSTLERTSGGLALKDGGVAEVKLAAQSVSVSKLKLPAKGSDSAINPKVALTAAGSYQGTGNNGRLIYPFVSGIALRHLVIRQGTRAAEIFTNGSDIIRWNQPDGTEATDITFNGNHTFTVDVGWNAENTWYYWYATGEWSA